MQTLKFLGRGSAFNTTEGNTSAYIKDNNTLLLIDCGESVFQKIIETKLLDDIKDIHVLITHLNSDHVGSLSSLIYYCYYVKQIKITIYFPTYELYNLLNLMGNTEEQYNYNLIEIGYKYKVNNNIKFGYMPIRHIDNMNCYMLGINFKDKSMYYSGDSNEMFSSSNLSSFDELYQDTSLADYEGNVHLSLRKLCEIIPEELRNKVYCMHLDNIDLVDEAIKKGFNVVEVKII